MATQGAGGLNENFRALLYAQEKDLREKIEFLNNKSERAHGHLFDRVQELEEAMGPALGSVATLETWVHESEKRIKTQGDVAVNHLYAEIKRGLDRFEERAMLHDENFLKKAEAADAKRGALLDIRVQRALENKGLESITEIDKTIKAQCLAEVPRVALQVLDTIQNNPVALMTQNVKGEISALVNEKTLVFRGEMQKNLDEAKMEVHTEIGDLRTQVEGGSKRGER